MLQADRLPTTPLSMYHAFRLKARKTVHQDRLSIDHC
uniref:Uncharacterized protein n=1 Tax=Siphoviridae sp. ctFIm6 TaxID=2827818 RepID=A0A8S5SJN8_9CAUD|nr:MAG TPA: hypothetical protein [Siphoviridae sp. ctFIm6]